MLLLRRLLSGPISRHLQTLVPTTSSSSSCPGHISNPSRILLSSHFLSSRCLSTFGGGSGRDGDGNDGIWNLTPDADDADDIFGSDSDVTPTAPKPAAPFQPDDVAALDSDTWSLKSTAQEGEEPKSDIFSDIYGARKKEGEEVFGGSGGGEEEDEEKPWSFGEEEEGVENVFGGDGDGGVDGIQGLMGDEEVGYDDDDDSMEEQKKKELAAREEELKAILKGDVVDSNFG